MLSPPAWTGPTLKPHWITFTGHPTHPEICGNTGSMFLDPGFRDQTDIDEPMHTLPPNQTPTESPKQGHILCTYQHTILKCTPGASDGPQKIPQRSES